MYSGFGKHGQGTSFRFSKRTSSTIADAGLKMSTAALALTFALKLVANVALPSASWLWAFEPSWNEPEHSIVLALHGLTW